MYMYDIILRIIKRIGCDFMSNPLISVIMPVFNVERYLEQAVNSVLQQTYENFEIILVDDKSKDSSPEICDKFVAADKRIQVVHKAENQGVGFARNTGLELAKGEYILFVDPDDYLDTSLLSNITGKLTPKTEILVFGVNRFFEDKNGSVKKAEKLSPAKASTSTPAEVGDVFIDLNKTKIFPFVWNKLYKTSFLKEIDVKFEKTNITEDFLFNIHVFSKANYIDVIPDELYYYRKPQHETLASAYNPDFFNLCKRKYLLEHEFLNTVGSTKEENYQLIYAAYVRHLVSVFLKNKLKSANLSKDEQLNQISLVLNDELTVDVLGKYIPDNIVMKIISAIFKTKNPQISYIITCFASFIF